MTADLSWLDELEKAHAAAWRGELRVGEHYGIHLYAGHDGQEPIGTALRPRDADRIVSDSNAVPELVARIRAGLALADELERLHDPSYRFADASRQLRAALTPPTAHTTDQEQP